MKCVGLSVVCADCNTFNRATVYAVPFLVIESDVYLAFNPNERSDHLIAAQVYGSAWLEGSGSGDVPPPVEANSTTFVESGSLKGGKKVCSCGNRKCSIAADRK